MINKGPVGLSAVHERTEDTKVPKIPKITLNREATSLIDNPNAMKSKLKLLEDHKIYEINNR